MKGTMTGNRCVLKLKGKVIGAAVQSAEVQDSFGLQRISGLGSPKAKELVVGEITHQITLATYKVSSDDLVSLGYVPKSDDWLLDGGLEIEVVDNGTNKTQELYVGCKAESHSRSYPKHAVAGENATFFALDRIPA